MKRKLITLTIILAICLVANSGPSDDGTAIGKQKRPQVGVEYHPPGTKGGLMMYVPAGEFMMGCNETVDDECLYYEKPYHKIYLDAFYINKYEVTVEQYGACILAGKCTDRDVKKYDDCNYGKSDRGKHPINCVDWYQSKAFCEWVGKRLPTEAEWEKAARGTEGRKYPWGNQNASCDYAVTNERGYGCGRWSTWSVGSKPRGVSPYGVMDMAGNVWEWTSDWFDKNYYKNSPSRNPKGPSSGSSRVLRGGSWYDDPKHMRASARHAIDAAFRNYLIGFRCAKTP